MNNRNRYVRKRSILFLMLIVAIVIVLLIINNVANSDTLAKNDDEWMEETFYTPGFIEDVEHNMKESLSDCPSDIVGLSKYEKYEMGLEPEDGSDSDQDGLTDKEEMEVYGTNPMKASTADDFYTDGYKVAHGMDLFTYYEYEGLYVFLNNACPEIHLTPKTAGDFGTNINEIPCNVFTKADVLKEYHMDSSACDVTIDVEDICNKNQIREKDIEVYINPYASEIVKCKTIAKENAIELDYDFTETGLYDIILVNKRTIDFQTKFWKDAVVCENTTAEIAKNSILERIVQKLFDSDVSAVMERIPLLKRLSQKAVGSASDVLPYSTKVTAHPLSEETIRRYTEMGNTTNFNLIEETLPFPNFSTKYTVGGSCVGISSLTALLHNNKGLDSTGSYLVHVAGESNEIPIQWDLTTDSENATLMDYGLADYKNASFVKKHLDASNILSADLSEGENQFLNMLICYDYAGNDILCKILKFHAVQNGPVYKCSQLENVYRELDEGKLVIGGMGKQYINSKGHTNALAHAVIIYGYKRNKDGSVNLLVYDCNHPGKQSENISIKIVPCKDGEYFHFFYKASDRRIGKYSSTEDIAYTFIIADDHYNILVGDI